MDFKDQLAAQFGRPVPPADAAPQAPDPDDLLSDQAHLGTDWLVALRAAARSLPGGPDVGGTPSLAHAEQVTNVAMKQLKKAGRKRDARDLGKLRDAFVKQRDKEAWSRIKARFSALDLSDKAYRSLKQGGADPVAAWQALDGAGDAELQGMGADRLKALLG